MAGSRRRILLASEAVIWATLVELSVDRYKRLNLMDLSKGNLMHMLRASRYYADRWSRRLWTCNIALFAALGFTDSTLLIAVLFLIYLFCAAQVGFYAARMYLCQELWLYKNTSS